ncbi:MAG: sigma-70 family RNA polymerase sigma factor [Planctomycetaceae bacterium]|nr:sigma-70 family RNA polymerase sigma factor [Planctomycetaceae bacterium]
MHHWPQIIDEFGPVVWNHALRMLGNETDAADCFQNVMLEAYECSQKQSIRNWPGFLKHLATLRTLDYLRARYRQSAEWLNLSELPDKAASDSTDRIDQLDLAEHLRQEISLLPEDQAEAFTLRWIHEMTNGEVAEAMQLSPNHVGVLLHRARTTLRNRLQQGEED